MDAELRAEKERLLGKRFVAAFYDGNSVEERTASKMLGVSAGVWVAEISKFSVWLTAAFGGFFSIILSQFKSFDKINEESLQISVVLFLVAFTCLVIIKWVKAGMDAAGAFEAAVTKIGEEVPNEIDRFDMEALE